MMKLVVGMVMLVMVCAAWRHAANDPIVKITKEEADKGMFLAAESDCLTCHHTVEASVGPSYTDIAKKYRATQKNIDILASKIITGGSGRWSKVPMTPHFSMPAEDAKLMVKYIFFLKQTK